MARRRHELAILRRALPLIVINPSRLQLLCVSGARSRSLDPRGPAPPVCEILEVVQEVTLCLVFRSTFPREVWARQNGLLHSAGSGVTSGSLCRRACRLAG